MSEKKMSVHRFIPNIKSISLVLFSLLIAGCYRPPSYCDLYPAGNSHAGQRCLYCYKGWSGNWFDRETDKPCTVEDRP